jgi:hypothetical protein
MTKDGRPKAQAMTTVHKFYLGQQVAYHPSRWVYVPSGIYVVTAKLPGCDGEFEYHIRNTTEQHERMARESELLALANDEHAR